MRKLFIIIFLALACLKAQAQTVVVHHASKVGSELVVKSVSVSPHGDSSELSTSVPMRGLKKIPIKFIEDSSSHRLLIDPELYFVADEALELRLSLESHRHPRINKRLRKKLDRAMQTAGFDHNAGAPYDLWVPNDGIVVREEGVPGKVTDRKGSLLWAMSAAIVFVFAGFWWAFRILKTRERDEKIDALMKENGIVF